MDRYDLSAAIWIKSSYSGNDGGDCLEVATWIKSSHSGDNGGNCVEIAPDIPGVVPVRDSKNPDGPVLVINRSAWAHFVDGVPTFS
ncbi:DUF397 domain-containing protein [Streptomyces neyagawaensis]|uniref:DUF397 domain-containing protein n=1 Tax=Streptomyces neyagawaensis TaxID=42238 RepID=UPI001F0A606C|nr:DUF397 domain-containing protein [Streptomyces neyagawaensis]MCL6736362.1 DUF397 domain-containing protein [Streptomyces neyagawaensis]MDE1686014.1 DUF397 domain-containing protein [Streptomyces neyagawaensis]